MLDAWDATAAGAGVVAGGPVAGIPRTGGMMVGGMMDGTYSGHPDGLALLTGKRSRWPGWRLLWLWLRQDRPRDFPVVIQQGLLTARYDPERNIAVAINAIDWNCDGQLMRRGILTGRALLAGLCIRYPVAITFPDGHIEYQRVRVNENSRADD